MATTSQRGKMVILWPVGEWLLWLWLSLWNLQNLLHSENELLLAEGECFPFSVLHFFQVSLQLKELKVNVCRQDGTFHTYYTFLWESASNQSNHMEVFEAPISLWPISTGARGCSNRLQLLTTTCKLVKESLGRVTHQSVGLCDRGLSG